MFINFMPCDVLLILHHLSFIFVSKKKKKKMREKLAYDALF